MSNNNSSFAACKGQGLVEFALILVLLVVIGFVICAICGPAINDTLAMIGIKVTAAQGATDNGSVQSLLSVLGGH